MSLEYHPALRMELLEIRNHYESCVAGLGEDFLQEFERQIHLVEAAPSRWMVVQSDIRRSPMKRFPCVILFRVLANGTIRVTVVKHIRRHPTFGLHRK